MDHRAGGQDAQHPDRLFAIGARLGAGFDALHEMGKLARQRHALAHRHVGRLVGGEGPLAAVLPDRVPVDGKLALPRLDIVEHGHRLGADDGQPPLAIGIEPRGEEMAAQAVRKAHMQMREVAEIVEERRPLAFDVDRLGAGDGEDHRQVVRRQIPQRVVLGMEFAEAKPVRVDVAHLAELAIVDQRLQHLERRMEAQHMADHEHAAIVLCRLHRALGVGDRQRDRLLHQHVLAACHGAHGGVGVELRGQRHDDGIDVGTVEQSVRLDRQTILLAGETFGASPIDVGNGSERAKRLEGADMVAAPVSATEDGDARLHSLKTLEFHGRDIATCPAELNPVRVVSIICPAKLFRDGIMRSADALPSLTALPRHPYIRATLANASKQPPVPDGFFEPFAALAG